MGDDEGSGPTRRLPQPLEWLFRDRVSGGITVAQLPNLALVVFIVGAIAGRLFEDGTTGASVGQVVARVAVVWWAIDEVVRGVNPWRRILGVTVLTLTVIGLLAG